LITSNIDSNGAAAALQYYKRAESEASQLTDIAAGVPLRPIAKVGIVGAGTMGGGIAMNFLNAGIPVLLTEVHQRALDQGLATIRSNYERSAIRGKLTQADVDVRMSLLQASLQLEVSAERTSVRTNVW
jgi:3-hydroxyacyl-CoA dehydrogenase